eukprot:g340.t1
MRKIHLLFLVVLLTTINGSRSFIEARCEQQDDSTLCTEEEESSYSTYHKTSHSTTESSTHISVQCNEVKETNVNGTRHFTNCSSNALNSSSSSHRSEIKKTKSFNLTVTTYGVDESTEDAAKSQASESAPSLEETQTPSPETAPVYVKSPPPPATTPLPVPSTLPVPSVSSVPSTSPVPSSSPVLFSVCGYHKPTDPNRDQSESSGEYYRSGTNEPCSSPSPEITVQTSPVQVTAVSRQSSVVVIHPTIEKTPIKRPVLVLPNVVQKSNTSELTTKRLRSAISSGNFSAVAQEVMESDDIYGLTMGLVLTSEDKNTALKKSAQRNQDGDVVAMKGLLSAGLDSNTKGKVVQLLVLAVTSPAGYHFSQFRPLVEELTEIVDDDALLEEIIHSNPLTYSRRMLLCANCTPVYSFICAHCWPRKVCKTYFWCPKPRGSRSSRARTTARSSSSVKSHRSKSKEITKDEDQDKANIEAIASMESQQLEVENRASKTKGRRSRRRMKKALVRRSRRSNNTIASAGSSRDKENQKRNVRGLKEQTEEANKGDRS